MTQKSYVAASPDGAAKTGREVEVSRTDVSFFLKEAAKTQRGGDDGQMESYPLGGEFAKEKDIQELLALLKPSTRNRVLEALQHSEEEGNSSTDKSASKSASESLSSSPPAVSKAIFSSSSTPTQYEGDMAKVSSAPVVSPTADAHRYYGNAAAPQPVRSIWLDPDAPLPALRRATEYDELEDDRTVPPFHPYNPPVSSATPIQSPPDKGHHATPPLSHSGSSRKSDPHSGKKSVGDGHQTPNREEPILEGTSPNTRGVTKEQPVVARPSFARLLQYEQQ
ncbi:hypothetical protein ADEAN_000083300 [Angomonas deanei]|uniref:Uncharacterized protein n=1 Tax=Angomonas deanei TaxID=59799 RepID=A0A7G2C659_9TRYP|nr:hypothetical protein ADEAN_000083300 [Angomonas deanei]